MNWKDCITLKNYFYFQIVLILPSIIIYNIFFLNQKNKLYEINFDISGILKEQAESNENNLFIEDNLNHKNNIKFNNIKKDIIVGIDFGSINTGFTYIIGNKKEKIITNKKFPSEFGLSRKTHKGVHYSDTSSISLMNYRKNELDNVIYINGIKYILNLKNNTINDNTCFIYPGDVIPELNIRNVLTEYFIMLKNGIINQINKEQAINGIENKILWVISVPSTWNEFGKQLLKNSISNSGMKNNKLIYESEATSMSIYHDNNIQNKFKNENFMLIDAGGFFIDISVNEFTDNYGNIKYVLNPKTYYLGINKIIEEIIKILEDLFGIYKINYIKNNNPGNWIKILKDINNAIENVYSVDRTEIYEINAQLKNDKGHYYYNYKNKRYKIEYNEYTIIFPGQLIGNIILNNINEIISNIEGIINELNLKNVKLRNIIITGGFSNNKIFQNEIEKFFLKNEEISIKYLSSYQTVISKGSVLYEIFNNEQKETRISPITLGIKNNNKMEIILNKGDKFKNILCVKFLKPAFKNQKIIQINIYSSYDEILNEGDLEKYFFGRLLLKISNKNDRLIQLAITYDTCLNFYAFNSENGKEIETEFQYFK